MNPDDRFTLPEIEAVLSEYKAESQHQPENDTCSLCQLHEYLEANPKIALAFVDLINSAFPSLTKVEGNDIHRLLLIFQVGMRVGRLHYLNTGEMMKGAAA